MNKLYELRKEKGVRQADVAEYIGCSYQAYQKYEKSQREPDFATLFKLADFYGVTVDYLLGRAPTYEERNSGVADYILTPDKQELLMYYEEMTPNERETLLNYAKFLTSQK